jgi:hypothetical protein
MKAKKTTKKYAEATQDPLKVQVSAERELIKEVKELAVEVRKLKNLEFVKILKHPGKFMFFSFLKGTMVGLGSILGASFVLGILIFILGQISFVPIAGEFVKDILGQIGKTQAVETVDAPAANGQAQIIPQDEVAPQDGSQITPQGVTEGATLEK